MDQLDFQYIYDALKLTFPNFSEEELQETTTDLTIHLFEFAKKLLYSQDELELVERIEAGIKNQEDFKNRYILVIKNKMDSLQVEEQQVVKELILNELVNRGHQLYKATL